MSTSSRLLGFIAYPLIQSVIVSSFPGPGLLSPRQSSCDTLVCPTSWDNFVGGAETLWNDVLGIGAGVAGWAIDKSTGLLVPQPVESDSKKEPDNGNAPVAEPMQQPSLLDTPQDQCTATSDSNPNDETGQVSVIAQSCGPATLQLVWALNCDNAAENSALEAILKDMDSEVFAVTSPHCPTQNGVWFWVGKFTPEQIESIEKAAHVVKTVEPDIPVKSDFRLGSTGGSLDPAQFQKDLTAVPYVEDFSLQRRAGPSDRIVSVSRNANPSLSFLSTAPGKQRSNTYASFKPPYTSIKIIVIEFGVIGKHPEIAGLLRHVINARKDNPNYHDNQERFRETTAEDDFRGTCIASMIGGSKNGVAKVMYHRTTRRLTVVKIDTHIFSFLAGLKEVYDELLESDNRMVVGYNVVIIPVGFYRNTMSKVKSPHEALLQAQEMIEHMVNQWQVVFVVAAVTEENPETNQAPQVLNSYPALWADRLPIVVVGAVDVFTGENPSWSYDGPQLTVRGPAQGYCLGENPVGTSVASAYVGGLVAYFLSLPDVGAHLRGQDSVPIAMIEYLRRLAYSRSPSDTSALAVWNGLDASKAKQSYSFWIGDPAQDVEI